MDVSVFLAKVFGLYLVIISIAMIKNAKALRSIMRENNTTSFKFNGGAIALLIGILLLVSHNIWEPSWKIIITIFGWMAFIKGLFLLMFPKSAFKFYNNLLKNTVAYYTADVITLIAGLYLCYIGFMAN